jgi:CrcB protein
MHPPVRAGAPRPVHLHWGAIGLVFAGGTVGTALRELLTLTVPPVAGVAVVIVGINVVGAFLLGLLLETLTARGPDDGGRRQVRLLLGTGVLGGFTTYSALATDTSLLLADNRLGAALLYALGTVLLGALASWAGIITGALIIRGRRGTTAAA